VPLVYKGGGPGTVPRGLIDLWQPLRRAEGRRSELVREQPSNEDQMDILEDVKQIIAKQINIPVEQLNADTKLTEIGIESLDDIEIVFALEEKFDISIPFNANESVAEAFATVGQVADAVKGLVGTKASG
jgi:acyl carrier protein